MLTIHIKDNFFVCAVESFSNDPGFMILYQNPLPNRYLLDWRKNHCVTVLKFRIQTVVPDQNAKCPEIRMGERQILG